MNSIYFLFFNAFLYASLYAENVIRNSNLPSCRNCVFYKPLENRDFSSIYSQCEKFGDKNILTNEIKYDLVKICRIDETKCGIKGKYFKEEKNIDFKIWKHSISNLKSSLSPLWIFTISNVFLQIYFILKK